MVRYSLNYQKYFLKVRTNVKLIEHLKDIWG